MRTLRGSATRRRLASVAASLALLALLASALYLRTSPGGLVGYPFREGDDVDYYYDGLGHRELRAVSRRWRKRGSAAAASRTNMEEPAAPAITLWRERSLAEAGRTEPELPEAEDSPAAPAGIITAEVAPPYSRRRSQESCVLITSQGGVASTAFLVALGFASRHGAAPCINDNADRDWHKHMPATGYSHTSSYVTRRKGRSKELARYHKVLVIVGDPIHTIESTFRRFNLVHVNKLRRNDGMPNYAKGTSLRTVYEDMVRTGRDTTGLFDYVSSWHAAATDREHWPEIRMVTAPSLFNHAEDHARWLGVRGGYYLKMFRGMSFDASKQHKTEVSVGGDELAQKVREVFGPVYDLVRELDGAASPTAGDGTAAE